MGAITYRMIMILEIIAKRNSDGTPVDLDQIIERVDYQVTKQAIQHTIRGMIERGLIEKVGTERRRDRRRVLFATTALGQMHYRPAV